MFTGLTAVNGTSCSVDAKCGVGVLCTSKRCFFHAPLIHAKQPGLQISPGDAYHVMRTHRLLAKLHFTTR
jgi:hypothetical protein